MKVGAFVFSCALFLAGAEANNHFATAYLVYRSTLNATYNVLDQLAQILDKLPPNVLRKYIPKSAARQLYTTANNGLRKEMENRMTLSKMLFENGVPYTVTLAEGDISHVSQVIDQVAKWTLGMYAPTRKVPSPAWMLYDRDPRWYPDCVGNYRCKRVHDFDFENLRNLQWESPLPAKMESRGSKIIGSFTNDGKQRAENKGCSLKSNSSSKSENTGKNPYDETSSIRSASRSLVRPRDIIVTYLN